MNLDLEENEQIIISSGDVVWISDNSRKLDELVLTNKGLYCCYREKQSFFGKAEERIYRFELSDIIKDEEMSHIEQVKAKNERCIQIEFRHGMEHFSFQRVPRKIMEEFFYGFQRVLGVPDLTAVQKERSKEMLSNLAEDVLGGVGTLLEAGSRALYGKIEKMAENSRSGEIRGGFFEGSKSDKNRTSRGAAYEYTYYEEGVDPIPESVEAEVMEAETLREPEAAGSFEKSSVPPPISEENLYYLALGGEQKGPFRKEEIRELAGRGLLGRDTLAWTRGMAEWRRMEEIGGLKDVTDTLPPVLR